MHCGVGHVDGCKIDLLKVDCEGSEWTILRDPSLLRHTKEFCLEYHLFAGHSLDELRELIEASGHLVVNLHNTKDGGEFGVIRSVLFPEIPLSTTGPLR